VGHGVSSAQFQTAYTSLLRKVRTAYPQAWIFALETFRGRYVPQTQAAVKAAVDGGDSRVSFVDTTGWLGSSDLTDSVHPNDQGHRVIADRLAPVIAARIGL
jgi:lysophospholipase L1-like esterase